MTCGLCGSGITACEKFKKQQNGNVHRYVYYGCCRFQDKNCPSGYLREDALIEQLANLMDKISLDEIGMKEQIKAEIERHKKFQSGLLGHQRAIGEGRRRRCAELREIHPAGRNDIREARIVDLLAEQDHDG